MLYIPYLLRSQLLQIDPLLDVNWQEQLELIFKTLDMDMKIEVERQILKPKQIIWHRISNTFESTIDTSLQVLKFKLENKRMRDVVNNIIESLQFVNNNDNILYFADYIENILKQVDEIQVEDDLKLLEEKESIRKIFLYHIAKYIQKKHFSLPANIRDLTSEQVKNFILEVYIKHEILGYWFSPMSSIDVQNEPNFFFKYFIRKQQKVRKFTVVKTSQFYFFIAPGKQINDNIYSIRRFLQEDLIEYNNKIYIYGLVLPLIPSSDSDYISTFKALMEKMVTIEYKLHQTVIETVATMENSFNNDIFPLFVQQLVITENNLDLVVNQHLQHIEQSIVENILAPLKKSLNQDLNHQDEFDYMFHSVRHVFLEMLNCFDVFKQQPLFLFNKKIQEFGYRILSYLKLLERRRDEIFLPLSRDEQNILDQRSQAPLQDLYNTMHVKLASYLQLQSELKELERSRSKKTQGKFFNALSTKSNLQKSYSDLFHEVMLLKKQAYQDLIFIPKQYKKYCVQIQDENLMSIQGKETFYAFCNGDHGISLLPILFVVQNDLTEFSIEKIMTQLNQNMASFNPFSIPKNNEGFFIET